MSTLIEPSPPKEPTNQSRPLNVILAVLGGLVLLTLIISATRGATANLSSNQFSKTANVQGITALDVEASAGTFTVQFADTSEAVLDVKGSRSEEWKLERTANELRVSPPGGWFNWCFIGCNTQESTAVLTLPQSMNNGSLNAELSVGAGDLSAEGDFLTLDLDVSAGSLNVTGAAKTLTADLGAGYIKATLADVNRAELDISAGNMQANLSGTAPASIKADVSAGKLDLFVPDVPYNVVTSVSVGEVDNDLQVASDSPNKITVEVSAGNANLQPINSLVKPGK